MPNNLEKIKKYLKTEKIKSVHIGETTVNSGFGETFDTLTIETEKHTIILTLEAYNYLSLKDYLF